MMIAFFTKLTNILVLLWNFQPNSAQNITNLHEESCNCTHVTVSTSIDPVSSTYTFNWILSIDSKSAVNLALVGLDGRGGFGMIDQRSGYNYTIVNQPAFLPNQNNKFTSNLIFMFPENEDENIIFKTVSTPLEISMPHSIFAPRCSETIEYHGYKRKVICSDGSRNCFCSTNNISGYVTCNNENITVLCSADGANSCSEKPKFNFSSCPSRCSDTIDYEGYQQNVSCSNGSADCFCSNSNIPGQFTCNDKNITVFCTSNGTDICSVKPKFHFSSCPSKCNETFYYQGYQQNVYCSDGSRNCFCSNSNISGYVTCNEENITVLCGTNGADSCLVKPKFNFSSCLSRCSDTINYQGYQQNVFCSDGSRNCFCSNSNIPGYITCNEENITAFCSTNGANSCLLKSVFNLSSCPSRCRETICYQGFKQNVFCSDGSRNCFCSNSNISGYVTYNGENITAFCSTNGADSCLVKPEFNFTSCPSRCSEIIEHQGSKLKVSCFDGSSDCFCSDSKIPGYVTCNGENVTVNCTKNGADSCSVKPEFDFSICPSRCSEIIEHQGLKLKVSCFDGSRDCFCSESDIPGYVTYIGANITVNCTKTGADSCSVKPKFDLSICLSKCSEIIEHQGSKLKVSCFDGSSDCFGSDSNIPGYVTCNGKKITVHCTKTGADSCSVTAKFDFNTCPSSGTKISVTILRMLYLLSIWGSFHQLYLPIF